MTTAELIRTACDALVVGADSQGLRELAGASDSTSRFDIEDLVEQVAAEFGFEFHRTDSSAGRLEASRLLARRCVNGHLLPREFARWMHTRIGHGHENRLVETLVTMDDRYDVSESYGDLTEDIDQAVLSAARELMRLA